MRYSDEEILAELRRVAAGSALSRPAYDRVGRIGKTAISRRFGSWSAALAAAGIASPYKRGGIWFKCPICGTPFRSDNSAKSRRTCSTECGKASKTLKVSKGRAATLQAARGRGRRAVQIEQCARCAATNSRANRLEVHHRDRDPYNNEPANLEVVCRRCHNKAHREAGDGWSAKKPRSARAIPE